MTSGAANPTEYRRVLNSDLERIIVGKKQIDVSMVCKKSVKNIFP